MDNLCSTRRFNLSNNNHPPKKKIKNGSYIVLQNYPNSLREVSMFFFVIKTALVRSSKTQPENAAVSEITTSGHLPK